MRLRLWVSATSKKESVFRGSGEPEKAPGGRAIQAWIHAKCITVEQLPDRRYRLAEPFLAEWLDRDRSTRMEHGA